ncbi:MAG: hypothetical protein M3131_01140, partial [Actinomycetota bacterium]|nr:hypothetical protein [Actinomycetota bacterium]
MTARFDLRPAVALIGMVLVVLLAPAAAGASSRQLTILQDDGVLLGHTRHDPSAAMAEAKALGVDVVRVFVSWYRVSPRPRSRSRPDGFEVGDPDSPGYDWSPYDAFVERARSNGLKV